MKIKIILLFMLACGCIFVSGCQTPTTFETSVSLVPPVVENADPNAPAPIPPDPLDVLAAIEKIAGKAGLQPYSSSYEEVSLLDIADNDDILDNANSDNINVSEWKHPDLPVYLTVTRKTDEIIILLNHNPEVSGKISPDAQKLFESIQKQLADALGDLKDRQ